MSLIRQLWLLVIVITVTTCTGSLVTSLWSNRQYLEDQLQIKNHDNAASLAISLSQQGGDMTSIGLLISAQYDTGHYLRIRLLQPDGQAVINLSGKTPPVRAPAWFVELLPIESSPGIAQVSAGWNPVGSIEVVSHSAFAHDVLWSGAVRLTLLLTLFGLVAGLGGTIIVRRTVTPLSGLVRQAQALSERRFIKSEPSSVPELMSLTQAMNGMVDRVESQYAEHAATVERLRRAATTDPVTGIANRDELQSELRDILGDVRQSGSGAFLMIRVLDLQRLNQERGHGGTDLLLRDMANRLLAVVSGVSGAACGRLNGSDFAAVLPGHVFTEATLEALAKQLAGGDPGEQAALPLAIGCALLTEGITTGRLLANADAALAEAEANERGIAIHEEDSAAADMAGQNDWRKDLQETLARRQIDSRLKPVLDVHGAVLHQQAEIHISWGTDDRYHPPSEWMPFAMRTGMAAAIEEIAIEQCVQMADATTLPIALRLSEPTLRDAAVLAHLAGLLSSNPAAASRLCIEIPESVVFRDPEFGIDLGRTLKRTGAAIGLADAGTYFSRIPSIPALQLEHIKVSASLSGARNAAGHAYLSGIVSMAHGMGIRAYLCGVPPESGPVTLLSSGADGMVEA
jgi:predicted signal transduction protein with EAL and GGDEF domain